LGRLRTAWETGWSHPALEERAIHDHDVETERQGRRALQRRHVLLLVLTVHAGAMDALGFIALQAFTSVQTGNLVLAGVGAATDDWSLTRNAAVAIGCFAAGCYVGARIAGLPEDGDGVWPRAVTRALIVQSFVMAVFAIGWWVIGSDPPTTAKVIFLMLNSLGMGIQSAAVQRFGTSGLSTTYLTGMLTVTMVRIATSGFTERVNQNLRMLGAAVVGAVAGGLLLEYAWWAAPILQFSCLLATIAVARLSLER
jgi:uncharacterized membrane protein YoaK (UPF0700 family)